LPMPMPMPMPITVALYPRGLSGYDQLRTNFVAFHWLRLPAIVTAMVTAIVTSIVTSMVTAMVAAPRSQPGYSAACSENMARRIRLAIL
jgi:uncharacterized membrane protein